MEATITLNDLLETPELHPRHFLRYSYGAVARSFFGINVSSATDKFILENEAYINETLGTFRPDKYPVNTFKFLQYFPRWLVPSLAKMDHLREVGTDMVLGVRRHVENHIKQGIAKDSVYREFLENRSEHDVSDEEAENAIYGLLGGATRSTQNALLAFVYLMMEYPEWLDKLQRQVDEVVGQDRLPHWDDVPNLPMVRAVVKEGVRYRSIVAELGLPHRLQQDDVYEGHFFAKGTTFHANFS